MLALLLAFIAATGTEAPVAPVSPVAAVPLLLVVDVVGEHLTADVREAFGEGLVLALARRIDLDVQSRRSVAERLNLAVQQQETGCDSSACMAEIADALGARFVAFPRIVPLGEQQVLRVEVYDFASGRALALVSVQARRVGDLVPRLPDVVELLIDESAGALPVRTSARAIEMDTAAPTSPLLQAGLITGGVGLGTSLIFGSLLVVGAVRASSLAAAEKAYAADPRLDNARAVVAARGPLDSTTATVATCSSGCVGGLGLLAALVGAGMVGWDWLSPSAEDKP